MNRFDPFRKSTHAAAAGLASQAAKTFVDGSFTLSPIARFPASPRLAARS